MNSKNIYFLFIFILFGSQFATAQDTIPVINSTEFIEVKDTSISLEDLIKNANQNDTIKIDSIFTNKKTYKKSQNALSDEVDYGSKGKKKIDLVNKIVYLWDEAYVNYQDIQVKGDYITFDFENNLATAVATYDTLGNLKSKATFIQGETSFQYDYLKYNFKTEKGIIKQAVTQESELFIHGATTKFVSSQDSLGEDVIYNKDALVTSCNLDHPHFGIKTNKLKVIPNKLAIIGPSQLYLGDVPTPLWLPFGFFPIAKGKSSGLILPKSYDLSPVWGFGLQNIGYYLPINDYLDAKITGDIYLRGSWSINTDLKYNQRYKYSGGLLITRSSRRNEDRETGGYFRDISYNFQWTHRQDSKAHPFRTFNTSVRLQTAGFNRLNRTDARSTNNDNVSSSVNYSYQFGTSPWSITSGANITQSLQNSTVNLTLPEGQVSMRQVFPFKKKVKIGKEKWFEKIGLSYDSQFKNYLQATDTTFYTADAWKEARYGISHGVRSNASFKFLKYFSFNPSASYNEIWFFKEVNRSLTNEISLDSIGTFTDSEGNTTILYDTLYGEVIENIDNAFLPFRTGNIGGGIATKLFWTETKSKGFLRGFRHTITPSLNANYSPDTKTPYQRTFDTDLREDVNDPETYSIIPSGVFSASPREANLGLSFSAQNIIEIKYHSKKDSTDKKYTLTNFSLSSNYNFVADSFKLARPTLSGRSSFFQNRTSINYNFIFDPYKTENGRRVEKYFYDETFEVPQLSSFVLRTTTSLKFSEIENLIKGKKLEGLNEDKKQKGPITLSSLFKDFSFEYKIDYTYNNSKGIVTKGISTNSLNINGDLALTDKWQLNLGNFGYDFARKGYTYPDFGFSRDLHCWRMTFSWQPRGAYNFSNSNTSTFNFFIGVNSGALDFLKYNAGRGNFDSGF